MASGGETQTGQRRRIAILGGGTAALTAAFGLTSQPHWSDRYEITVYQLGWRLGGKGASSRGQFGRIEEHGLHVWLGSYENAFHIIRRCYKELDRPLEAQLATWEQAFKPRNVVALDELVGESYDPWLLKIPMNQATPGESRREAAEEPGWSEMIAHAVGGLHAIFRASPHSEGRFNWGRLWISAAKWLANRIHTRQLRPDRAKRHHAVLAWLFSGFQRWMWRELGAKVRGDAAARRLFTLLDFGMANLRGIIEDDLWICGVDHVDELDYREWLGKHGARQDPTLNSVLIRALYDLGFSYLDGDAEKPHFAAGAAIRTVLRMILYKGAFVWGMQAGMGETIFAPLYEVLERRGVRFRFFHRVTDLIPGIRSGDRVIAQIHMARQVTVKGGPGKYDPLLPVNGIPCWPPHPIHGQIEEGEALERGGYDLESFWTEWRDAEPDMVLELGEHFDDVVLGISLGAFPHICAKLKEEPGWRDMIERIPTVQTQSFQVWLKPDTAGLGWPFWKDEQYILDVNSDPFDTWADMSHLLHREMWPPEHLPNSIHYFCSALPGPRAAPPRSERDFAGQEIRRVKDHARLKLQTNARRIWPASARPGEQEFNWGLLIDPEERVGEGRMAAQYYKANIDPSERYVFAMPGTLRYRMRSDQSGYRNLYLAGDWTRNGLNVGAIESAVMSGMQAARAICGYPEHIAFETFAEGIDPKACRE